MKRDSGIQLAQLPSPHQSRRITKVCFQSGWGQGSAGGRRHVIASLVSVMLVRLGVRFGKSNPLTRAKTAAMGAAWGELQSLVTVFSCCVLMLRATRAVLSLDKFRLKED